MRLAEPFTLMHFSPGDDPFTHPALTPGETLQAMVVEPGGGQYVTRARTTTPSGGAALTSRFFLLGDHALSPGMMVRRDKDGALYRVRAGSHRRVFRQGLILTAYWVEKVVRPA